MITENFFAISILVLLNILVLLFAFRMTERWTYTTLILIIFLVSEYLVYYTFINAHTFIPIFIITVWLIVALVSAIIKQSKEKDKRNNFKKTNISLGIVILLMIICSISLNVVSNYNEKENANRSDFYEIDKIMETTIPGDGLISKIDFDDFKYGSATLEALISKFGIPTHVFGAQEGDAYMQVCFPSNESGFSIDMTFKNEGGRFGDWILTKKGVVETSGISLPSYEKIK